MSAQQPPGLFGLRQSSRDFSKPDTWGKNQFNSSFPASLACYCADRGLDLNYVTYDPAAGKSVVTGITTDKVFGYPWNAPDIYFDFETPFDTYARFLNEPVPSADLLIRNARTKAEYAALEVKLTVIPDSTTSGAGNSGYAPEIVVRPVSIFYLAASMLHASYATIDRWHGTCPNDVGMFDDAADFARNPSAAAAHLRRLVNTGDINEVPVLLNPVWKAPPPSHRLVSDCLDVFVWSNTGLLNLILDQASTPSARNVRKVSRAQRSAVWLFLFLRRFVAAGPQSWSEVVDRYSLGSQTDKACSFPGNATLRHMASPNLTRPRIADSEIPNVILSGGETFLSPERRFDAALTAAPHLFP